MQAAQELADATHAYEKIDDQPTERSRARILSLAVINELSAIDDATLTWREITVKYLYSSKAKLLVALVSDRDEDALVESTKHAKSAEENAAYALVLVEHFRNDLSVSESERVAYLGEITNDGIVEQIKYIRPLVLAYLTAAGIPDAKQRFSEALIDIDIAYLREQTPNREGVIQWFCSLYPDVRKLCSSLGT